MSDTPATLSTGLQWKRVCRARTAQGYLHPRAPHESALPESDVR
ncbi:MAG TPA: hypothetical protein VFJ22_08180 [Dermatophilaceae bacterium]|jgi:hypothetical protein|nr:hypothetical protein [Dermatophilaceae bacterium]